MMNTRLQNSKRVLLVGGFLFLSLGLCFFPEITLAQGGGISGGINAATNELKKAISPLMSLFYVACGIIFIIGAFKVASKFSQGDPDAQKVLIQYLVATIVVGILPTILKSVFGIG